MSTETQVEKKEPVIKTMKEAERAMALLVKLEGKLAAEDAKLQEKLGASLEVVGPKLADLEVQIASLRADLREFVESIKTDATYFSDKQKTLRLTSGELQYNAGQPSIDFQDGYDEKTVLLLISERADLKELGLVRSRPELNKDAVMAMLNEGSLKPADLTAIGLKRKQEPTISVKPLSLDKLKKAHAKKTKKQQATPAES